MDPMKELGSDHEFILELLPDYATGALDDATLAVVEEHLDSCDSCRSVFLDDLHLLALLAEAPSLRESKRNALLLQAEAESNSAEFRSYKPAGNEDLITAGSKNATRPTPTTPLRKGLPPAALPIGILFAAAAILLIAILGPLRSGREITPAQQIAQIVTTAPFYQLGDSALDPPASGVIFAQAEDSRAVLLAQNLPPLEADQEYQIWLFDSQGARSAAGRFAPDSDGHAEVLIETAHPMKNYAAVAVSAEPASGSSEPTSPLALGGWLP